MLSDHFAETLCNPPSISSDFPTIKFLVNLLPSAKQLQSVDPPLELLPAPHE
jgi:hypothetical protein